MNRTTVVGSVHAIEKDGQATVCQQPQGAGGGPRGQAGDPNMNLSLTLMAWAPLKTSSPLPCKYPSP